MYTGRSRGGIVRKGRPINRVRRANFCLHPTQKGRSAQRTTMHTAHASPTHQIITMRDILCLLYVLVWATTFAGAQEGQELPPRGATLKVTTSVVNVYAVVRQKNGRLIPDLTKDDFVLEEDQQPQVIKYFSRE